MIRSVLLLVAWALSGAALAPALERTAWDFERPDDALAWRGLGGPNVAIISEEGGHVLAIRTRDERHTLMASCQIALDPSWRRLLVATRMRASGLVLGQHDWQDARLSVEFHAADGTLITYGPPLHLGADAPWTSLRRDMEIPSGAATVVLVAANFADGACDFDDIRVVADPQRQLAPSQTYLADFATVDADGLPPGWCLGSGQQRVVDGALALDATLGAVEARAVLAVDPSWRRVRITCRLRAHGLVCGPSPAETARLDVDPLDGEGRQINAPHPVPSLARDADWHQQTIDIDLPAGTRWLLLRPGNHGRAGVFFVDDLACSAGE